MITNGGYTECHKDQENAAEALYRSTKRRGEIKEGGTIMYENEIYSGDRTGDHTTGTYQSYNTDGASQGGGSHIPQEPVKKKSGGFGKN